MPRLSASTTKTIAQHQIDYDYPGGVILVLRLADFKTKLFHRIFSEFKIENARPKPFSVSAGASPFLGPQSRSSPRVPAAELHRGQGPGMFLSGRANF